jgi:hypothetical protein
LGADAIGRDADRVGQVVVGGRDAVDRFHVSDRGALRFGALRRPAQDLRPPGRDMDFDCRQAGKDRCRFQEIRRLMQFQRRLNAFAFDDPWRFQVDRRSMFEAAPVGQMVD